MDTKMLSRNRRSLRALCIAINSEIELKRNPRNGKLFFTCGTNAQAIAAGYHPTPKRDEKGNPLPINPEDSFTIYGSPRAVAKFQEETAQIADFQYAESSKDNGATYVPTLMIVGEQPRALRTMGAELLH